MFTVDMHIENSDNLPGSLHLAATSFMFCHIYANNSGKWVLETSYFTHIYIFVLGMLT